VSLTAVALMYETIYYFFLCPPRDDHIVYVIIAITIRVVGPVAVLVINVMVAVQARRAASNFGVQPHHQTSTSNNSAVPTVMLVATSIIYALVYGTFNIISTIEWLVLRGDFSHETKEFVSRCNETGISVGTVVFAYNFYVYLITGRQFRSELRKLLCRCLPSSATDTAATANI